LSESNGRPTAYKAVALPTELNRRTGKSQGVPAGLQQKNHAQITADVLNLAIAIGRFDRPIDHAHYLIRFSVGRGPLGGLGGSCSGGLPPSSGVTSWTTLPSASLGAAGTLESGDAFDGDDSSAAALPATGTGNAIPWPFSRA
jgi:hypothetical protein